MLASPEPHSSKGPGFPVSDSGAPTSNTTFCGKGSAEGDFGLSSRCTFQSWCYRKTAGPLNFCKPGYKLLGDPATDSPAHQAPTQGTKKHEKAMTNQSSKCMRISHNPRLKIYCTCKIMRGESVKSVNP